VRDLGELMLSAVVMIIVSYLIGSISFAVLVSKVAGLPDPGSYGSGNPGATNVLRTGNKSAAIATLIGDALKGVVAVLIAKSLAPQFGWGPTTFALVGLAAFLGHCWPVFFKFKGGKGVATAAGVLFTFSVWLGAGTALTWASIAFFFRYSSLAALVSAVFAVFYQILLFGFTATTAVVGVMALVLIFRHRANIEKLLRGQESRLGRKPR
jgi:acyl phosphate:glycerol-3-phosphate acyltransferase